MLAFVVPLSFIGSALAGGFGGGHLVGGHLHHEGPIFLKGLHHGPAHIPHGPPALFKGGLPPVAPHGGDIIHGPPVLIKGGHGHHGHAPLLHGPAVLVKGGHGIGEVGHPPLIHGPPLLLKGGHGIGDFGHAPLIKGPPVLLKGGHGIGHVDHAPIVHGPSIVLKGDHIHHASGLDHAPIVHGPPIIEGPFFKGGHAPLVSNHLIKHGPIIGGHKSGGPAILLKGIGGGHGGHEQHAVSGPSYLITTVHHVQKVSGGGKLIASFSGGHAIGRGHGPIHNKVW